MWSFLSEFMRKPEGAYKVIIMDEEYREQPRHHSVRPRRILVTLGLAMTLLAILLVALIVMTPLRELIPGYGTASLRRDARLATVRLVALQDSLAAQQQYMAEVRQLLTGRIDSSSAPVLESGPVVTGELAEVAVEPSENWTDHQQPAWPIASMQQPVSASLAEEVTERYLSSLQLPAQLPVSGFVSGPFDARTGHYAIDIVVKEGTMVRSIGDGYVVLADWTHEGGYAIAVQHADGYLSVYKHNQRLLKRVGDRVRTREAIALSGNSGEFTTGPHLHFELWRDGLAQDPAVYLIGL